MHCVEVRKRDGVVQRRASCMLEPRHSLFSTYDVMSSSRSITTDLRTRVQLYNTTIHIKKLRRAREKLLSQQRWPDSCNGESQSGKVAGYLLQRSCFNLLHDSNKRQVMKLGEGLYRITDPIVRIIGGKSFEKVIANPNRTDKAALNCK
jgi:hypothetical protein